MLVTQEICHVDRCERGCTTETGCTRGIALLTKGEPDVSGWSFAGWFINDAAEGDPPHWSQVAEEHANDPDVVALGFEATDYVALPRRMTEAEERVNAEFPDPPVLI